MYLQMAMVPLHRQYFDVQMLSRNKSLRKLLPKTKSFISLSLAVIFIVGLFSTSVFRVPNYYSPVKLQPAEKLEPTIQSHATLPSAALTIFHRV